MRRLLILLSAMLFTAFAGPREAQAATIVVDSGWLDGTALSRTDAVAFDFTLASAGVFSLTDCCVAGDVWTIAGSFAGVSTLGLAAIAVPLGIGSFPATFDPVWLDATFTHFQVALAAGFYSITVTGDGAGGFPASFGVRADLAAVPVPAAGLLLFGALAGLGALRRRRGKTA